jgi:hypothetical protein
MLQIHVDFNEVYILSFFTFTFFVMKTKILFEHLK